ncbi:MAG TPA: PIG-L family deacetylase [Euzebyales bacterium]|nr:PIG-L family deacetylase [Euzebyales bacterium]
MVAHPDDIECGTSAAIGAWTARGIDVAYLLLTRGEAGMDNSPPERTGPMRVREQLTGSEAVGVAAWSSWTPRRRARVQPRPAT